MLRWLLACLPDADPEPPAARCDAVAPRLIQGGVQACADPLPAPTWREVGAEWGLIGGVDPDPTTNDAYEGGAMLVDDLDLDGDLDLLVAWRDNDPALFLQDQGRFLRSPLGEPNAAHGYALADLDGDGRRDVVVPDPLSVLYHRGDGWEPVDLDDPGHVRDATPGDLDGDGLPELYLARNGPGEADRVDHLWVDGALVPLEGPAGGQAFDATWVDLDGDGDADVYAANDLGGTYGPSVWWRNEGGVLVDAGVEGGCDVVMDAMSVDVADANGDGWLDLYQTAFEGGVLLHGEPGGTCTDVTTAAHAELPEMAYGGVFLDHDNDGDVGLLLAGGWEEKSPEVPGEGLALLDQEGGTFHDVGPELGLDAEANLRTVVAVDWNDDGVLDLIAAPLKERPLLYLSDGCTEAAWLEVEAPPGTRVEVEAGGHRWVDEVSTDSGRGGAVLPRLHLGLGAAETVDRLRLTLPDQTVLEGCGLPARQRVRVE